MNNWKNYKISEVCEYTTGSKNSGDAVDNGEYIFYTCDPKPKKIDTYEFEDEAVLLAGNNANGIFHTHYHRNGKFDCYQRTYVIRSSDENTLLNRYLYYLIELNLGQFKNRSIGTTTQYLTQEIINNIELQIPPIDTQKKIVLLLDSIDRKIDLNYELAELLEETAYAIYESWFEAYEPYDIPDNREYPDDFSRISVNNGFDIEYGYGFDGNNLNSETGEPVIRIQDIEKQDPDKYINEEYVDDNVPTVEPGDTLIGLTGYNRHDFWKNTSGYLNQRVCRIRGDNKFYNYFKSDDLFAKIHSSATGTAQKNITQELISNTDMLKPDEKSIREYEKNVEYMFNKIILIYEQNRVLSEIQDYLLPQLLSGEVVIQDEEDSTDSNSD